MADAKPDILAIFTESLARESDEERSRHLDEACQGDPQVRGRVEALLRAHSDAGNFLGGQSPAATPSVERPITEQPGTLIGRYKLLELIGEGGFGDVYMAEQTEPVRRKVALKIIKLGMDTRQVIARFEAERQALAMMDHPNIAQVHDAGATDTGRPYFVMELVQGVPITEHCDQNNLTTKERLELFIDVCQAIQHAHLKGVIHRDIKPTNVMVTLLDGKPVPKMIDFGIAKATQKRLTEKTCYTDEGQFLGTPQYMSPEQAGMSDLDVDIRTDVYSLGVLLYELLTGTMPFEREKFSDVSFDELRRIIREEEPPRPSIRLSTLDVALETVAENRATDARTLSQQLSGELDWIVIKALEKDRTRRYQTANSLAQDVQRHLDDEPVEACPPSKIYQFRKFAHRNKTLLTASTAVALALLVGAGISTWQAYRATKAESEARNQQERAEGNLQLALEAVDQIYLEFVDERSPTFSVDGSDRQEPITPEGERFLRKALTFYERFAQANQHDPLVRHEAAKAYHRVGSIRQRLKMYHEGVAACSQTIRTVEQLTAEFPEVTEYRETLAAAYCTRGDCYQEIGELDKSITDLSKAIRLQPDFVTAYLVRSVTYSRNGDYQKAIADCNKVMQINPKRVLAYNNRGHYYLKIRNLDQAIADHNEAIRLNPKRADSYNGRGLVYADQKEYDLALADFNKALELKPDFAGAYNNRGKVYRKQKKYGLALADYNKTLELKPDFAWAYNNRGTVYREQKKYDLALADFNKALELDDPDIAILYYNRGSFYDEQKKYDLALADYNKALELNPDIAYAYNNRGEVYRKQKKYDLALAEYNKALELDPDRGNTYNNRGLAYHEQKKYDLALADYNKALELEPDPDYVYAYNNRGIFYYEQKKYDLALADYNKALELEPDCANTYNNRGAFYNELEEYDLALADYNKALELEPDCANVYNNRGYVYRKQKKYDLALQDFNKALKLQHDFAQAYKGRGLVYEDQKKYDVALLDFYKALELKPDYAGAYDGRGRVYCTQKKYDLALADYNKALELDRDTDNVRHDLALFLLNCPDPDLRDTARALGLATEAVKAAPKKGGYWSVLGQAHYRSGDYQLAVEALTKSIELDYERKARNWFFLALAHWKLGHKEQAHEHYQQAAQWMAENQPPSAAFPLSQFRDEAAKLLGIQTDKKDAEVVTTDTETEN